MAKLSFDGSGDKWYQTGIYNTVLYTYGENENDVYDDTDTTNRVKISDYALGVPWNGVTSITESPQGAEVTAIYADNIKYLNLASIEDFKATIEAYTYPDEFAKCDGSYLVLNGTTSTGFYIPQQTRKKFGLVFKTNIGTDIIDANDPDAPYVLHIIYNCRAGVSDRQYQTINDSPEAMTFSWDIETQDDGYMLKAPSTYGLKSAIHLQIRTDKLESDAQRANLKTLESILYGTDNKWVANKSYTTGDIVTKMLNGKMQLCKAKTNIQAGTAWTTSNSDIIMAYPADNINTKVARLIPSHEVLNVMQTGKLTINT